MSTGIQCLDNDQSRGVHCSEKKLPHLEKDMREIVFLQVRQTPISKASLPTQE